MDTPAKLSSVTHIHQLTTDGQVVTKTYTLLVPQRARSGVGRAPDDRLSCSRPGAPLHWACHRLGRRLPMIRLPNRTLSGALAPEESAGTRGRAATPPTDPAGGCRRSTPFRLDRRFDRGAST